MTNETMRRRILGVALGAMLAFAAGCQREPLQLEVNAETPYDFLEWQEAVAGKLPQGVAKEFNGAVARIVASSPSKMSLYSERMMHSRRHPICRELHRRTVREVIIKGYGAANDMLLRGMILESDNLVAALKYEEAVTTAANEAWRVERMVERRSAAIGAAKAQVAANQRRIAELERDRPGRRANFFVRFAQWRALTLLVP